MSTIDSPDIIQTMLENNGIFPGNPQCHSIWSYVNDWNTRTYKIVYSTSPDRDVEKFRLYQFLTSPHVRSPVCLWRRDQGLTSAGQAFVKEDAANSGEK